jgi:hypothetical protein
LNDVLNSLPTAVDAPFDAYHRQHDLPCLPDTRVDLLRDIYSWADGQNEWCIFWLNGLAGTGKSTIGSRKTPSNTASTKSQGLDWNRHEKNIYGKIVHWFEVIKEVLQDPAVLVENVYNMDETGVMLSMPSSVKVLISKYDKRDYRGARVKRTSVTAIECISGDGSI